MSTSSRTRRTSRARCLSASGSSARSARSTSWWRSCGRSPESGDEGGTAVIPNVTRGGKTHGVLVYLVGKGKREEHTDPHLVAGSPPAMTMAEGRVLERGDAAALARFLDEPREQFGTRVTVAERDGNGKVIGARDAH